MIITVIAVLFIAAAIIGACLSGVGLILIGILGGVWLLLSVILGVIKLIFRLNFALFKLSLPLAALAAGIIFLILL